jgi:hypothetical protein
VILLLLRVGAGAGTGAALVFEIRLVGLVAGVSSASLATDDVSDGAGEAEGIRCLVDVELAALVDRRGGIVQVSNWWSIRGGGGG